MNEKIKIMTVDLENDLQSKECKSISLIIPKLLNYFDDYNIRATFFTTSNLLGKYESEIKEISKKHEIASHSHTHSWLNNHNSEFEISYSKQKFKDFGINVKGFRAPGLIVTKKHLNLVKKFNYKYDSSFGTFYPGRYFNLTLPNKPFLKENILEFPIPSTIYPAIDNGLPYLKLFHPFSRLFPNRYMFYLHPWEFLNKKQLDSNSLIKKVLRRNSGKKSWKIFDNYINKDNTRWISCEKWIKLKDNSKFNKF